MNLDISNRSHSSRPAVFEERQRRPESYAGAERRRKHRRGHKDRREDLRFELDKTDRRVCAGRRADDKNLKFW